MLSSSDNLEYIIDTLSLTGEESAAMFGVTEGEIDTWILNKSVPVEFVDKIFAVAGLVDTMSYKIRDGLLPEVVRRKAAAYNNRSMLDLIEEDDQEWLIDDVDRMFRYDTAE